MNDRDADLRAELQDRADIRDEPPELSMARLRRMNAARTEVSIIEWSVTSLSWDVAVLSCGHEIRLPVPFGHRHPVGTLLSCETCRNEKMKGETE